VTARLEAADAGRRGSLALRLAAARGGSLPDDERAELVAETCRWRPVECIALLAAWAHDEPGSPALGELLRRVRSLPEGAAAGLDLALVAPLAQLYGAPDEGARAPTPREALEATDRFSTWYAHAAPFSREALAALWERCAADARRSAACAQGRALAEELLGPLPAARGGRG
jgi:hypothetical protein